MSRTFLLVLLGTMILLPGCYDGRNGCVSWHSTISTPGGEVRAREIEPGDLVTSLGPDGSLGMSRVIAVRHARSSTMLAVTISDGRELWVTPDHPVGVPGGRFLAAGRLQPGDTIRTGDADMAVVRIDRRRGDRVVDLTVEPDENFFANGVLVHNKTVISPPPKPTMPGRYVNIATGTTIELTETGGRLFIPRPMHIADRYEKDSVWDIGPWTLNEYTMTAPLTRRLTEDWLSRLIEQDTAVLVIRAVDTRGQSPARPHWPPSETVLQSVRIETRHGPHGLGSAWTTPDAIERALRGFESNTP